MAEATLAGQFDSRAAARRAAARTEMPRTWPVPQSLEAEKGVLGSMLLSPREAADEAREKLVDDSFFDPRNRDIFCGIKDILDHGVQLDLLTLRQWLHDRGLLDRVGGDGYLAELVTEVPTPAHIFSYIGLVRNKYLLRRAVQSCAEIIRAVQEDPEGPAPVLEMAQQAFFEISSDNISREARSTRELAVPVMKHIEERVERRKAGDPLIGVPTGFKDFDNLTGGLNGGEMIVFAARPGVGKTSFALNIAEHAAVEARKKVGIFSLEMTAEQLMLRLLASRARIDLGTIRRGFVNEQQFHRLAQVTDDLMKSDIMIDDSVGITMQQLRTKARRLQRRHGLDLVIIDYLQLLQPGIVKPYESRQTEVAEISGSIKGLAKELSVPVIVLCQLNRKPEERGGQPRLSDLRESGAIEQDADLVGMLYRPDLYRDGEGGEDPAPVGEAVLDVQKHRNGPTQKIDLTFLKQLTRFETRARVRDAETGSD